MGSGGGENGARKRTWRGSSGKGCRCHAQPQRQGSASKREHRVALPLSLVAPYSLSSSPRLVPCAPGSVHPFLDSFSFRPCTYSTCVVILQHELPLFCFSPVLDSSCFLRFDAPVSPSLLSSCLIKGVSTRGTRRTGRGALMC
eukprot:200343-Pleurochrysis_carterae.AAC.1